MRRLPFILTLALAGVVALAVIGDQVLSGPPKGVKRTVLLRADLSGREGEEGVVSTVELPPGRAVGKHWHPGHEFIYILEGSAILEREGKPPVTLKPGDSAYIPPRLVHDGKNPSKTTPFKAVEFSIEVKGRGFSVMLE